MQGENWREREDGYKPLVDTGRELLPLENHPKDLDFSKTVSGTSYVVRSRFNPSARETLLGIVIRWFTNDTDVSEKTL